MSSLDIAREIYVNKELNKGVALVDSLKQLVTCVDELAKHKVSGLKPQADRLGECYNSLLEVNRHLEGALQIIADHSTEVIRIHLEKEGIALPKDETKTSKSDNRLVEAVIVAIIAGIIVGLFFEWGIQDKVLSIRMDLQHVTSFLKATPFSFQISPIKSIVVVKCEISYSLTTITASAFICG